MMSIWYCSTLKIKLTYNLLCVCNVKQNIKSAELKKTDILLTKWKLN
jgi:hypothetical protein